MKRREFVTSVLATGIATPVLAAQNHNHGSANGVVNGPLASATISFGQWPTTELDRFEVFNQPTVPNINRLIPNEVTIKAGGTVNFIVAGFHNILVYAPGTLPGHIDTTKLVDGFPPGLIDDPTNRLYRGLDPRLFPQDRVEAVHFAGPGRYLVACGVLPHFNEDMFGWVRVLP